MSTDFDRRAFLLGSGAMVLAGALGSAGRASGSIDKPKQDPSRAVKFRGDGLSLSPTEYMAELGELAEAPDFEPDVYSTGGIITRLEDTFARMLGKEAAVLLPSGTLANHLALRALAVNGRRVLVQADSHVYNDTGDGCQSLSGLNLLPIEERLTADEVLWAVEQGSHLRLKQRVGAVSIESPVRRRMNGTVPLAEMKRVADVARAEGIGMHLDGARIFVQAAHQDLELTEIASHFDTVYVSLYKNFDAAGGAILAGPTELLAPLRDARMMFGGSVLRAWTYAAVALSHVEVFQDQYRAALQVAEALIMRLDAHPAFEVQRVEHGTSSFWLKVKGIDPADLIERMAARNVELHAPRPVWPGLLMQINPTLLRMPVDDLAEAFEQSAS